MICPDAHPPSFGLLLRQVRDGLVRQLDTSMAEENLGIGFTHYLGLKVLAARAPCTANELAQALDQDRRALQIGLTEPGRQLWARLKQRGDQTIDDAMRDLSPDERAQLLSLMTRVRDSLVTP